MRNVSTKNIDALSESLSKYGGGHANKNKTPSQIIERAERMFQAYQEEEMHNLDKLFEYIDKYQKPVLIFGMNSSMLQESPIYAKLREKGLMIYPTPERAAKALAHLVQYSRYLNGA